MSDIGNKEIFASNLLYYMESSGKTRSEICDNLGIAYSTFSEWVSGRKYPRIDKIELLANYFGIQKSQLIERRNGESEQLSDVYFSLAKDAQDQGIDPDDIRLAIETIKNMRSRNN